MKSAALKKETNSDTDIYKSNNVEEYLKHIFNNRILITEKDICMFRNTLFLDCKKKHNC